MNPVFGLGIIISKNLLLIYTGFKRTAHDIASSYVNKLQKSKKKDIVLAKTELDITDEIISLVDEKLKKINLN